jgi:hypothetical protein
MRHFVRPCLVFLVLAAFAAGCRKSESGPRRISGTPDTRLQRTGPAPAQNEGNQKALPP